jgi:hypothetical protein
MDPYKFEDNLANVCFSGLTARSIPHGNTRANAELLKERVDLTVTSVAKASNQMAQSASGAWFHNHYAFALNFEVITQVAGNNNTNHNVWVSNVRTMMSRQNQFFTLTNLPCYGILRLDEVPSEPIENPATDTNRTRLTFNGELGIIGAQMP